jgi:hypothetical protein
MAEAVWDEEREAEYQEQLRLEQEWYAEQERVWRELWVGRESELEAYRQWVESKIPPHLHHTLSVSPGGARLRTRMVRPDGGPPFVRPHRPSGRTGSPITGFTAKARSNMRWTLNALPWDEVPALAMVTLTYPGDWRACCPDGTTLKRHLRAFRERWRRKWGAPRGIWTLEFQPRPERPEWQQFAPHFHLYVGIPDGAELDADASDKRLVWDWAREAWFGVVKSEDYRHKYRGVHVRPCFYGKHGDGPENARKVGDYFWRESGKLQQKMAPDGFEGVKFWDVWGMEPIVEVVDVERADFVKMRRVMRQKRDQVRGVKVKIRNQDGTLVPRLRERWLDGVTVTNLQDGSAFGEQLLRWAQGSGIG